VTDIQIPVDLGFTEFVTSLLAEVLRSVVAAQGEQEERRRELLDAASLTLEEFAAQHVSDADVSTWLAQVLPSDDPDREHGALRGTPYTPAGEGTAEAPPYKAVLGVELPVEKAVSGTTGKLLAAGEQLLLTEARRQLAERQLQLARDLAERGIPRVIVDHGRINAKLTFEALQLRDEAQVAREEQRLAAERTDETTTPLASLATLRTNPFVTAGPLPRLEVASVIPQVLRDVRLKVHTADERSGDTKGRASVYGEVELTFKTV
jgi:hypothetical protein